MINFSQIPGQETLKQIFQAAIKNKNLPQTQLLISQDGGTGLALAFAIAQTSVCLGDDKDACGKCANCLQFKHGNFADLHLVFPFIKAGTKKGDAQSCLDYRQDFLSALQKNPFITFVEWQGEIESGNKQFTIPVSEAEQIIRTISTKTVSGKPRFILIWLPETLTAEAGNKLLKVLEEPGPNNYFVLISLQAEQILPTIRSRCIPYNIPLNSEFEISEYLIKRGIHIDTANQLALSSNGSIGLALYSIFGDSEKETFALSFATWMRTVYLKHVENLFVWSEEMSKLTRTELLSFIDFSSSLFERTLRIKNQSSSYDFKTGDFSLKRFAQSILTEKIYLILEELDRAKREIERNGNTKIILAHLSFTLSKHIR